MTDNQSNLNTGSWTVAATTFNDQLVVAYGRGRSTRIYATAYPFADARAALARCAAQHGPHVFARLVPAERSVT